MRRTFLTFTLLFLLALLACFVPLLAAGESRPKPVRGVLDLSHWNLAEKGPLRLDGEWSFFWQIFCPLEGEEKACPRAPKIHLRVPGVWNNLKVDGRQVGGVGYATYRLMIKLGSNRGRLAVRMGTVSTAFQAFADGELVYQSGEPSRTAKGDVPFYRPGYFFITPRGETVTLTFWVSNHNHWQGGIWKNLRLGTARQIADAWQWDLFFTVTLFGAILLIGLYHFAMGLFPSKGTYAPWFGFFCLFISIRLLTTGTTPLALLCPQMDWRLLHGIVYVSLYLTGPCFLFFLRSLFPSEVSKVFLVWFTCIAMLFALSVPLLPPLWYSYGMPLFEVVLLAGMLYSGWCIFKALRNRQPGGKAVAIGFVVLFGAALNDILHSRHLLDTSYLVHWGVFTFICTLALVIAARVSTAYRTIEIQSTELADRQKRLQEELAKRKKTEEALARERDYLEGITTSMGAGLALISRDFKTIWANKVLNGVFGDVVGKTCYQTYNQRANICPGCGVERVFRTGEEWVVSEQNGLDSEGREVWSEIIVTPVREEGQVVAALELVIPITARKKAEQEKEKLAAQLRQAQKMEAVGVLAGGVAHDFNNLLHIIQGSAQVAAKTPEDIDKVADSLLQISQAAKRAAQLVGQLLTFSRKVEPRLVPLDLNREVKLAADMLGRTLPKMVGIELDLADDLPPVLGNDNQLEQIVLNLGANASDAMPGGGRLLFKTSLERAGRQPEAESFLVLSVTDTGHGMDEETLEHIFEPFYTTKPPGKGTGLGLAAVYGVVQAHGGTIGCKSAPMQGTTISIRLPAYLGGVKSAVSQRGADTASRGGSETVLVVDDEPAIVELAGEVLQANGYRVKRAFSGEDALAMCQDALPDLVVMDLGMPGMGGRQALLEILTKHPGAKVLVASGYASNTDQQGLREMGAAGFLPKPFDLESLLRKTREVLDS